MNTNLKAVEEEKCNSKRKDGKGTEQKRVYIYTKFLDGQKKKKKKIHEYKKKKIMKKKKKKKKKIQSLCQTIPSGKSKILGRQCKTSYTG